MSFVSFAAVDDLDTGADLTCYTRLGASGRSFLLLNTRKAKCVEQRRFADVGETDDETVGAG
jgi:hypothetical protein